MRIVALLFLSILTLAGYQSKAAKVKQFQDQYDAEYPAHAKDCRNLAQLQKEILAAQQ